MSGTIRAFVAVQVTATRQLRDLLLQFEPMGSAVRAVAADKLHVTLKFLGDTRQDSIHEIAEQVQSVAGSEAAFDLKIAGVGCFPHAARPRVVWAGLENADGLARMSEQLDILLEPLGFAREQRRFQPHLTLARIKRKPPPELAELVERQQQNEFGVSPVESVELMQSELGPGGPRYTVLASASLASG